MERVDLHDGRVTLYRGDCREILPTLGKVDAVVTDPPYGIGFAKGASGLRVTGRRLTASRWVDPIVGDDAPFDPGHLLGYQEVILWGADHFRIRLPDSGRMLAWDKKAGWSFEDTFSDVEFAWHSESGAAKIISYLWKGVRQDGEKGLPKYHIMQKPIAVMEWCIGQLRRPAETILDPYMGSGTTGVAAVKLGRRFIGLEIDQRYFDIACRRIEDAAKQPDLFVEPAPKPSQEAFL
jgi:site-specific DNA-methyltransferase (adenine-specific)